MHYYGERMSASEYYKGRGELCNIITYWNNLKFEIVMTYFIACFLKLFNLFTELETEVKVHAKNIGVSEENTLRIKYFKFFS